MMESVGGYRIGRRLDEGRTNEIYEATGPGGRGRVVIRFLRRSSQMPPPTRQACRAEIARVARLRHPHIAAVLSLDAAPDGAPFLVREHLAGETLEAHLGRRGRVRLDEAVRLATHVALTLSAVHQIRVVHGDLRPSKVFVYDAGGCIRFGKLVGFGLWRLRGDRQGPGARAHPARYTSPELTSGAGVVDGRADQFALAAIVYRMLAGVDAFRGDDVAAVLRAVLEQAPVPLTELGEVSPAVNAVVLRGLAKRPADRYETIAAFAAALEAAAAGHADEVTRPVAVDGAEAFIPVAPDEITRPVADDQIVGPPSWPARPADPAPRLAPASRARPVIAAARPRRPRARPWLVLGLVLSMGAGLAWWTDWRPPEYRSLDSLQQLLRHPGGG
jgi:serine/threonine-protein kinase